ncbi:hypothetical protein NUU61_009662 [Penicillium alfredii]|uniref:Adenylate kinase isoenzyme 6 homolog n=1 Tax=Penicillium alfredii TaxID=1506179 RepID=A0A9W9EGI2_9EURO|nr:uncharacterized protein NUU61_009662 [Penicillium alfredii]KAJ5081398.1 hypothetical protein NUU61_009662 [Penicillium alfredii]
MDDSSPTCPLCPFTDSDANCVAEHIEFCHPENGALETSRDSDPREMTRSTSSSSDESTDKYVDCPHCCGETVASVDLSTHLDLHIAESVALHVDDYGVTPTRADAGMLENRPSWEQTDSLDVVGTRKGSKRGAQRDFSRTNTAKPDRPRSLPRTVGPDGAKKLGRAELGPHAHEKKMPSWLRKILEKGGHTTKQNQITPDGRLARYKKVENETDHLIPVLARLCEQDKSVQRAFLCSPKVRHICKMPREGGFCGYRNIQMLVSYLKKTHSPGHENFANKGPTILELQEMIELAWDMGFNSVGRTETGGIKGTRKYIGTPEAQALFLNLGVHCDASSLGESNEIRAYDVLFMNVADYFRSACSLDQETKVFTTDLPPIYFQHQGHSMTIVGFEIRDNGSANLLVFDPMFKTSPAIHRLVGTSARPPDPGRLLKAYRRGTPYLQKYKLFELLNMRTSPNVIITGTPGVGKTVHCEQLAQEIGLKHLSINQVAKDRGCHETYDEELKSWVVDEDKLLDALEDEIPRGGYLIDWHACDLFPRSWIDLVVVLRCPSTAVLYDRLASRGYHKEKLEENLDAEIFGVLVEEAREAFEDEIVVELNSEKDEDVENNCARVSAWVEAWKKNQTENAE